MADEWSSVDEIRNAFHIPSDIDDLTQVRRILRTELRRVHPDATNGRFLTAKQQADYHRVESALSFVDSKLIPAAQPANRGELATLSEFSEAIARGFSSAREQDAKLEAERRLVEQQKYCSREIEQEVKKHFGFLRKTAGTIALIFGLLSAFPDTVANNPVFQAVSSVTARLDVTLGALFLYLFLAGALAIVYLWWEENRELTRKKSYLGPQGVDKLIRSETFLARVSANRRFTKADLVDALRKLKLSRDESLLTEVADLVITSLRNRGAVFYIDKPSLTEVYELEIGVYYELRPTK